MNTQAATRARSHRRWSEALAAQSLRSAGARPIVADGTLRRVVGMTLEAVGCEAPLGGRCLVLNGDGSRIDTEVVGFSGDRLFLMPSGEMHGLLPNAPPGLGGSAGRRRIDAAVIRDRISMQVPFGERQAAVGQDSSPGYFYPAVMSAV
ncbi:MAG TPA: hypothetical protein PKC03_06760, partial [Dokdonella sp.]|nr:hypothetical protein [Dokdonella sp.]